MSLYVKSPFKPSPKLLVMGTPEYAFGSWNADIAPTQGNILSTAGNGTTTTYVVQILSGNIPVVDSLMTVVGTANAAGAYNLTNAPILTVSAPTVPDAGIYSITVAGAGTSAAATDAGQFYVFVPEVGDVLLSATPAASGPVCSPVAPPNSVGKSLSVTVKLPASTTANPSTLSGITVVVQGANVDADSEYSTIGTVVTAGSAGNTYEWQSGQGVNDDSTGVLAGDAVNLINFRFYRLNVTVVTGAGPIIGKLMV